MTIHLVALETKDYSNITYEIFCDSCREKLEESDIVDECEVEKGILVCSRCSHGIESTREDGTHEGGQ